MNTVADPVDEARRHFCRRLWAEVNGPDVSMPRLFDTEAMIENLLWEVGDLRRRSEQAHSKLDTLGAPRYKSGGQLTIVGRLNELQDEGKITR